MYALKKQAEEIQAQMVGVQIEGLSKDSQYKVIMNGNQQVLSVVVPANGLTQEAVQSGIKQAFEDARRKMEDMMKQKMMSSMTS